MEKINRTCFPFQCFPIWTFFLQVLTLSTQIRMALTEAWPLDSNNATGCSPDSRLHVALGHTMRTWTST